MHQFSKVKLSDQFEINMNVILGKGSTGCVYEGYDLRNNVKVAIKVIELCTIDNEVTQYLLKMEKTALIQLSSPYVLKGLKILQDQKFCFMVTEYCNGGTLKKYIQKNKYLSQQKSLKIVKALLQGYQNLVEKKVLHRDLKPANIMMQDQIPKIIDFGYCEIQGYKKPNLQYNVGSPSYMAPQSYEQNLYNQKTQIWSIGVILFQCLTGKTLDKGHQMSQIFKIIEKKGIIYPDYVSQFSRQLINKCLCINPKNRPTCLQLLQQFFSQQIKNPSQQRQAIKKSIFVSQKNISLQISINNFYELKNKIQLLNLQNFHKKNILQAERNFSKPIQQQRTLFGVLRQPQQQVINKYIENKIRPAVSYLEKIQNYKHQPQQPQSYNKFYIIKNNMEKQNQKNYQFKIQINSNIIPSQNPLNYDYFANNNKPIILNKNFVDKNIIRSNTPVYRRTPYSLNCHISQTKTNLNLSQKINPNPVFLGYNIHENRTLKNLNTKNQMLGQNSYTERKKIVSFRV